MNLGSPSGCQEQLPPDPIEIVEDMGASPYQLDEVVVAPAPRAKKHKKDRRNKGLLAGPGKHGS